MTIEYIPIRHLISGETHSLKVFRFAGTTAAPHVYIQAGLHAGELQGIGVAWHLINYFREHPPLGPVTIVPCANPFAMDIKVGEYTYGRFDPTTGENWNRQFTNLLFPDLGNPGIDVMAFLEQHEKEPLQEIIRLFKVQLKETLQKRLDPAGSYGKSLALTLQSLALSADIALDLHADSHSVPYLFAPEYAAENALYLRVPFVLLATRDFDTCFNQACYCPWWGLTDAYNKKMGHTVMPPFESFTFELGSKETFSCAASKEFGENILNYLKYRGVVAGNPLPELDETYLARSHDLKRHYAEAGGLMDYAAPLGVPLQKGELIGTLLSFAAKGAASYQDIRAESDEIPLTYTASSAVHSGSELYKSLTDYVVKRREK